MTLKEILTSGGGLLLLAMTLIQVSPVEINPWSTLARGIGRAINGGDVMEKLEDTRKALDVHIVDGHRARILQFSAELMRGIPHTEEEFVDVLLSVDEYQRYCKANPDYQNNRASHAIAHIEEVYDERLKNNDFL